MNSSKGNTRDSPLDQSQKTIQFDQTPSNNAIVEIEEPYLITDVLPKDNAKTCSTINDAAKSKSISFIDDSESTSTIKRNLAKDISGSTLALSQYDEDDNDEGPGSPKGRTITRPSRISIATDSAYSRLFGDSYNARESTFVIIAGALIAFNSGFVNGCCVSGLLDPHRVAKESVVGFAASYSTSALAVAAGKWESYGTNAALVTSYMFGAFLCGLITPKATSYRLEPSYGPTFMIGGCFLLCASISAALEFNTVYVFCLAAAASGIQNGIASLYSANLVRCTLTGSFTDISLALAQLLRGNRDGMWRAVVLTIIVVNFWLGGVVSFYAVSHYLTYTLLFNAGLFFLVGVSLVAFLVREIGISVWAALVGNWRWKKAKKAMTKLNSLRSISSGDIEGGDSCLTFFELFDKIDDDGSGTITPDELLKALMQENLTLSAKELRVLMKAMDANGDGVIDREEWTVLVDRVQGERTYEA